MTGTYRPGCCCSAGRASERLSRRCQTGSPHGRSDSDCSSNIGHSWSSLAVCQRPALFVLPSPSPAARRTAKICADDPTGMLTLEENTNPFGLQSFLLSVRRELVFFYVRSATRAPQAEQQLTTEPNVGVNNHRPRINSASVYVFPFCFLFEVGIN